MAYMKAQPDQPCTLLKCSENHFVNSDSNEACKSNRQGMTLK